MVGFPSRRISFFYFGARDEPRASLSGGWIQIDAFRSEKYYDFNLFDPRLCFTIRFYCLLVAINMHSTTAAIGTEKEIKCINVV